MRKKSQYITFILLIMLLFSGKVRASYTAKITGNDVGFRDSVKENSNRLFNLYKGDLITVLDEKVDGVGINGCEKGFVSASHQNTNGFVCLDYIEKYTVSDSCKNEMIKEGFTSSYVDLLCSLKQEHSNWNFKAIKVDIDFSEVVEKESACGKSYIISTVDASLKDSTCSLHDANYVAASQKAVAYYMDPRNFISEKYIFQFESLKYESTLEKTYIEATKKMLNNASFYVYHLQNNIDLSNVINKAGKKKNVNPIFLAARIKNELGVTDAEKSLYSGTFHNDKYGKDYYGYFNFYNINVSGDCVKQNGIAYCGLSYAKKMKWDTVQKAVNGGAEFLASSYISQGQYTSYFQKFNIVPVVESNRYVHQYMTNIQAPMSESTISYNAYSSSNMLDNAFVFQIPVYKNMDDDIQNSNNGAVEVQDEPKEIDENNIMDIKTIVSAAGYKINNDKYIFGINPNTKISEVKSKIEAISGSKSVTIESKNEKYIGTNSIIKINNGKDTYSYTVYIKGDTSGDGVINALDLLQVQRHILKTYKLKDASFLAGDTSQDNKLNALDLLQIQKHILKSYEIVQ